MIDDEEELNLVFTFFNEINIIAQLSSNAFARTLPNGLNPSQFAVLNWFSRVDSVATPGRLSTALMVTKGAMTNTLKKLQEKGLIKVNPHASSGRQKVVTMTALGREARNNSVESAAPLMAEILSEFSVDDIKQQLPVLRKLRQYLDESRYD